MYEYWVQLRLKNSRSDRFILPAMPLRHSLLATAGRAGIIVCLLALLNCLMVPMHHTYVLQSEVDCAFYTSFTKNLKLRFEQYNKDQVESTKRRIPLRLIYYEACISRENAIKREKYLKAYHGKIFLKRRLKSYLTG